MNFQTYCLKHRPDAREIGDAIRSMGLDIFLEFVRRADEPYIQRLGQFISAALAGTARVTLDEAITALHELEQLGLDEDGVPL